MAAAGGRAALSLLAGGKRQPVPPAGQCYYDSPVSCDFRPHAGARHSRCGFRKTQRAEGRRAGGGGVGTHRRQSMTGSAPRVSTCRACGLSAGGWGGVVLLLCPPPAPSPQAEPVREQAGGEWPCGRGPARGAVSGEGAQSLFLPWDQESPGQWVWWFWDFPREKNRRLFGI